MDGSHVRTSSSSSAGYRHGSEGGGGGGGGGGAALWPAQPVQLARGRQPRDALAKTVDFHVSSLDEFETSLQKYLDAPPDQPEHTEAQLSFWIGASFMVSAPASASNSTPQHAQQPAQQPRLAQQQQQQQQHQHQHHPHSRPHPHPHHPHAPPGYQPANGLSAQYGGPSHAYQSVADPAVALGLPTYPQTVEASDGSSSNGTKKPEHKVSLSIMEALQPTADPKEKMRKQRAIAKCCVDAIQRIDGYRYSFHNCWNSREDDSFRFSYYCNDSLLNKDRAANGKGAKLGKRATKPVYDCKGVLSIKFSATKQSLDVFYKHVPIHKTYEERAPPPRKDSKRRKYLEVNDPEALTKLVTRAKSKDGSEEPDLRPKKKKAPVSTEAPRPSNTSLESDLRAQSLRSLLELIQVDPSPAEPAPPDPPPPSPPPPPHPQHTGGPPPMPMQQPPAPPRRRPRNSCDVCKAKKTKCDGTRPVCNTCTDKKRQCYYTESPSEEPRIETNVTVPHAPAPTKELSEYEKMKKELEEAKARIQELESEKRASTTPVQTPQITPRPHSQPQPPQPQHRHSLSQAQIQAQQRQQIPPQPHRQQMQQLNRTRSLHSPQQLSQPQRIINAQPSVQTSPSTLQSSLQVGTQHLNTAQPQQPQQQMNQNYFAPNHTNHAPYVPTPQTQTQAQTQTQPGAANVDANTYRGTAAEFAWPANAAAYYAYQAQGVGGNAQQQQQQQQQQSQQDQWGQGRGPGVFR
ncbi:hypothetical protein HBH98_016670 [Parastagonospora nodorum]|nr:hypothetical protein HBH51_032530 [Parastagonospora nodorum]KAH4005661.1 hypothetical protein HBI10_038160 [Parastagonospora nodorum]KAH4032713.1 hypothetical protein HBI13_001000 [Parastagonospora nodorum]KAH4061313.1 hypothetical protein HBH49_013600 [Parastagonospora nodorum]KAH4072873.1 hypothetical protein HBH50_065340 [Parastagonospora nodorum]